MENTTINTPFFLDKGLWVAVLAFLLPILNSKLGLNLDAESIYGAIVPLIAYIVSHKWKTAMLTKAALAGNAAAAPIDSDAAAVAAIRGPNP